MTAIADSGDVRHRNDYNDNRRVRNERRVGGMIQL
jgi:hypothetical protein